MKRGSIWICVLALLTAGAALAATPRNRRQATAAAHVKRIPSGVRVVTISSRKFKRHWGPYTVTNHAEVRRIVRLVDRLSLAQPGAHACPVDRGPLVRIAFRRRAGAKPVAVAMADGSGCGDVSLRIYGRRQPGLAGGPGLIRRLRSLLGRSLG